MKMRPLDRAGTCVCGLGVALHFDEQNRKLTCDETAVWLQRVATNDARTLSISPSDLWHLAAARSC